MVRQQVPQPGDAAQSLRMAWFGGIMRNVAVTEGDKVEAERVFGFSVNTWGVNDLVRVVDAVSDKEIDALAAEYDEAYEVVPALRPGGERRESLRYAARQDVPAHTSRSIQILFQGTMSVPASRRKACYPAT